MLYIICVSKLLEEECNFNCSVLQFVGTFELSDLVEQSYLQGSYLKPTKYAANFCEAEQKNFKF